MDFKIMGKFLKCIFILIILFSIPTNCYALESSDLYDEFTSIVPEEYKEIIKDDVYKEIEFKNIFSKILNIFLKTFKESLSLMLSVCGTILAYTVIKRIDTDSFKIKNVLYSSFSVALIMLSVEAIESCVLSIKNSVDTTNVFSSATIPIVLSLCVISANSFSGAVFSTSVSFISVIMETVSKHLLIPLTVIYLCFALVNNFSTFINLTLAEQQIKKFIKWSIGIFITLFSFTMTLQNFLSVASDSVLKRSIKSAVGSFVPIVGSTLSSSIDSIFSIAISTKTTISVLGIVIIFFMFLPTLSQCLSYALSLSVGKFFAAAICEDKIAKCISYISDVFYLLFAICSACVVMMILSFLMICINIG